MTLRLRFTLRGMLQATTAVVLLFGIYSWGYTRGDRVGYGRGVATVPTYDVAVTLSDVGWEFPADGEWHELVHVDRPGGLCAISGSLKARASVPYDVGWPEALLEGMKLADALYRGQPMHWRRFGSDDAADSYGTWSGGFYVGELADNSISAAEIATDAIGAAEISSSAISSEFIDSVWGDAVIDALPSDEILSTGAGEDE